MKKKTLLRIMALVAFLMLPMLHLHAQETEEVPCMVLTQKDGTVSKFALSTAPQVTYEGSLLVVNCGEQSLSTSMADIEKITFEKATPDGIGETIVEAGRPSFSFGKADFKGLRPGTVVSVYSVDGKALMQQKADEGGHLQIDLEGLNRGVYIIHTPNQSYKIKK